MYKQSPSRNQRSKGIKVKHVLQIFLLLAVCFWLIYQVKHSHEKRKEFDVKDEKVVERVQSNGKTQRFGRKDLPRMTDVGTDVEKHGEDEEEKDSSEEEEEEESKHVEDEPQRDGSRAGEREEEEDSGRGGDDEIDENESERTKTDHELEEELLSEEKEREEHEGASEENHTENEENKDVIEEDHSESEENEDAGKEYRTGPEENEDVRKEDQTRNDATSDDHDGGSTNTHEAREENYKADDASSEVAQDIQTSISGTENATTGQANEMFGKVNYGQENETKSSDKDDAHIQSGTQPREEDKRGGGTSGNVTVTEQIKYEMNMTKSGDNSLQNSTLTSLSIDHPEKSANSATIGEELPALSSNGTQTAVGSNSSQNSTGEGASGQEVPNLQSHTFENANQTEVAVDVQTKLGDSAGSNKTEDVNTNAGESLSSSNTTLNLPHRENDTDTDAAKEDSLLHQGEKSNHGGTTVSDEVSEDQPSEEGVDGVQHDPIDESDTTLTQEEKDSRTDLDTLPDITSEVQTTEDAAAE